MEWKQVIWDPTPGGNVQRIEEHDLLVDDVEFVLLNYETAGVSQSSGRPCVFGHLPDGRYIIVVYEETDETTIILVTAFEIAL